jgi:hypothetical protein
MAKDNLTQAQLAEIGRGLLGMTNEPQPAIRVALPYASRTTASAPAGVTVVAGTDEEGTLQAAGLLASERRRVAATKPEEETVEPPPKEPTVKELLAVATDAGARAELTLQRIARERGIDLTAPPSTSTSTSTIQQAAEQRAAARIRGAKTEIATRRAVQGKRALSDDELTARARKQLARGGA